MLTWILACLGAMLPRRLSVSQTCACCHGNHMAFGKIPITDAEWFISCLGCAVCMFCGHSLHHHNGDISNYSISLVIWPYDKPVVRSLVMFNKKCRCAAAFVYTFIHRAMTIPPLVMAQSGKTWYCTQHVNWKIRSPSILWIENKVAHISPMVSIVTTVWPCYDMTIHYK